VVDPEFRVHGLPNLVAADSSVFPSAPGINPSFTIMALSQRAGQSMTAR
jgi:choline dehydrogenase-like flavoprotein